MKMKTISFVFFLLSLEARKMNGKEKLIVEKMNKTDILLADPIREGERERRGEREREGEIENK